MKGKEPGWMGSFYEVQEVEGEYGDPRAHTQEGGADVRGRQIETKPELTQMFESAGMDNKSK